MSPLHKIAIVGASGRLGTFILSALKENPSFDVTVISRQNSSATFEPDVEVVRVPDGYPDDEMVEAFGGHDAVVLSLGFAAEHRLPALARASIKAGVKRLIASGYGVDPNNVPGRSIFPVAAAKAAMVEDLKSLEREDWSWTDIACGTFLDFCIMVGFYGIKPDAKTAEIWDDGNARFSATTRRGIGLAVAGVLAKPEETENRTVYISSTELTLNELLAAHQQVRGSDGWEISHVKTDEEIAKAQEVARTATEFMPKMMAIGRLGLAVNMKPEYGADFGLLGVLENEKFGVPHEDLVDVIAGVRKGM